MSAPVLRVAPLAALLLLAAGPARGATPATAPASRQLHRIGVLAFRPKPVTLEGWRPLAAALRAALPQCDFEVEALEYGELDLAIAQHRIDLVITNPGHYIEIRHQQPMSGAVATVIEQGPGTSQAAFGGVIFVRAGGPGLAGIADLEGARVAAVGRNSLGGFQAQAFELVRAGLPVPSGERLLFTGVPHDRVVDAVLSGRADAGFVRSGALELMAQEGKLDLRQVSILNKQDLYGFPHAVSTRLWPGWPVVALSHVEEAHAARIAAALLGLEHVAEGGRGYHGFAVPADYASVENMLRELRLPPFEGVPSFGPRDVLRRYTAQLLTLAAAVAVIAVMAGFLAASNRRLERARREAGHSAATLSVVLATTSVAITKVRDRKQVWANRRMEELFGYSAAEMAEVSTRIFYPDDESYERLGKEAYAALSAGRAYVTEQQMRRKDGSLLWVRMRGNAVAGSGAAQESIWSLEDVTDRRRVEDELRRALAANEANLAELRDALSHVKVLSGLLPICMYCHRIRTDQGYWDRLESFITARSEALFSHGICPACLAKEFPAGS